MCATSARAVKSVELLLLFGFVLLAVVCVLVYGVYFYFEKTAIKSGRPFHNLPHPENSVANCEGACLVFVVNFIIIICPSRARSHPRPVMCRYLTVDTSVSHRLLNQPG